MTLSAVERTFHRHQITVGKSSVAAHHTTPILNLKSNIHHTKPRILLDTTPKALLRGIHPSDVAVYRVKVRSRVAQRGWEFERHVVPNFRSGCNAPEHPHDPRLTSSLATSVSPQRGVRVGAATPLNNTNTSAAVVVGRLRPHSAPLIREMEDVGYRATLPPRDGIQIDVASPDSPGLEVIACLEKMDAARGLHRLLRFSTSTFGVASVVDDILRPAFERQKEVRRNEFANTLFRRCPAAFDNSPRRAEDYYDAVVPHPAERTIPKQDLFILLSYIEKPRRAVELFFQYLDCRQADRPRLSTCHLHALMQYLKSKRRSLLANPTLRANASEFTQSLDDLHQDAEDVAWLLRTMPFDRKGRLDWHSVTAIMYERYPERWALWGLDPKLLSPSVQAAMYDGTVRD